MPSSNQPIIIGVDIAKLTFDVAFLYHNKIYHKSFDNSQQGFGCFLNFVLKITQHLKLPSLHLIMEATSVYWQPLAKWAYQLNFDVSVINPNFIRTYAKSLGIRTKTDKQDAILLARYGRHESPKNWQPNCSADNALITLTRERLFYKKQLTRSKIRLETSNEYNLPFINNNILYLKSQVSDIDLQIWHIIYQDPNLCHRATLLSTIPGIGKKTIPYLLTLIGDSCRFSSSKHLVSYVGLAPRIHESGTSIHKQAHIGCSGRADIREILYMPAVVVSFGRYPAFKNFVQRLQNRGKCKQQIIIAVMRKILSIAWAVIRFNTPYDPLRHA